MSAIRIALLLMIASWILTGCGSGGRAVVGQSSDAGETTEEPSAPDNFNPGFSPPGSLEADEPSSEPVVVAAPILPTPTPIPYGEIIIFDDALNPDWTLAHSENVQYDVYDTSHWFERMDAKLETHSGALAIAVTPIENQSKLFFTVKPESDTNYSRDHVLALSLWLNSGGDILDTDDLAIAVVGSNELTYWTPADHSVFPDREEDFSETRLQYLGINRSLPPDTWVRIVIWLDDLLFDPLYSNVTGFYLINDKDYRTTYYVDNITLLTLP